MEIGDYCKLESCQTLTYLPVNCPYCRRKYCQSHFLPSQHDCKAPGAAEADKTLSETEILKRIQRANERRKEIQQGTEMTTTTIGLGSGVDQAGPSKLPCQKAGCKQYSLQIDAVTLSNSKPPTVSQRDGTHQDARVVHAAPRCDRCRGFFCMS